MASHINTLSLTDNISYESNGWKWISVRSLVFLLALKTAVREATVRHLWTAVAVGEQITRKDPGNADHYRRTKVEYGV
jgi:hypothetical protein